MKNILKVCLLLALAAYLIFALTNLTGGGDNTKCTKLNIEITDSVHAGFITVDEVKRILATNRITPIGHTLEEIDGAKIEQTLLKNSFIKTAKCFKTTNGAVNILVSQRLPIMRIKSASGEDYYIDESGKPMNAMHYNADLAVATGHIDKRFARTNLAHLGRYLQENAFANDLVVQVDVEQNGNINIVPRIGCEIIRLGRADSTNYIEKMGNLQTFYTKVLPQVGWNKYRELSLAYSNQVVCKKKRK